MSEAIDYKLYARVKSCESGYKLFDITDNKTIALRKGN
jgi:hypothetical protein